MLVTSLHGDPRHYDIVTLDRNVEKRARLYPNWEMERVGADDIRAVLQEALSDEFDVSTLLDVDDPVPGHYSLEVSSPGFDRVLRKPDHYGRFIGSKVRVELLQARDGRRRYTGTLVAAGERDIELEVEGNPVRISFAEIGKTRLVA